MGRGYALALSLESGGLIDLCWLLIASTVAADQQHGADDQQERQARAPGRRLLQVEKREHREDAQRHHFLNHFQLRGGELTVPWRFAGTCNAYSGNAMSKLTRITDHNATCLYLKWPNHAIVMNAFEPMSSKTM